MNKLFFPLIAVALLGTACASQSSTIPGSKIPDSQVNRDIIQAVEEYRTAVERRDAAALLLMASKNYWEDGGTPSGADDYGYEGLRELLQSRFEQVEDVRYSLKYLNVARRCRSDGDPSTNEGCRAYVDVLIDASFTVTDARGRKIRPDKRDQNQLVLEWSGEKWLFLSGM
jgi:hypothetical protein